MCSMVYMTILESNIREYDKGDRSALHLQMLPPGKSNTYEQSIYKLWFFKLPYELSKHACLFYSKPRDINFRFWKF